MIEKGGESGNEESEIRKEEEVGGGGSGEAGLRRSFTSCEI